MPLPHPQPSIDLLSLGSVQVLSSLSVRGWLTLMDCVDGLCYLKVSESKILPFCMVVLRRKWEGLSKMA